MEEIDKRRRYFEIYESTKNKMVEICTENGRFKTGYHDYLLQPCRSKNQGTIKEWMER
jgi:predicted nucleic acid-binding protein